MNPFRIKFTSKDIASYPHERAELSFKTEKGRDEYWSAFWRKEMGFKPLLWEAERVDYPLRKMQRA
jgi:hypothetical protein